DQLTRERDRSHPPGAAAKRGPHPDGTSAHQRHSRSREYWPIVGDKAQLATVNLADSSVIGIAQPSRAGSYIGKDTIWISGRTRHGRQDASCSGLLLPRFC